MDKGKPPGDGTLDLKGLRTAAGLSQQRLAELSDCSIATVALFEKGYAPETSAVLPRILAALNVEWRPAGNGTPLASSARQGGHDGT